MKVITMITILVKIEGGIVQAILKDTNNTIKVIVLDKDKDSDPSISINEYTPTRGNINNEINEALLSDVKNRIGAHVVVSPTEEGGDDFTATLIDARIDGDTLLLVVKDQDDNVFDVESSQLKFDD